MSRERDEQLQRIYERGDQLRRQRASRSLSGVAAVVAAALLAAAGFAVDGEAGPGLVAATGAPTTLDDGIRSTSTPRLDDVPPANRVDEVERPHRRPDGGRPATSGTTSSTVAPAEATDSPTTDSSTVESTTTTSASAAELSTASACRNSTDVECGRFYYDHPEPNTPATIRITPSTTAPKVGERVTFTVVVDDPDGARVSTCFAFYADYEIAEPANSRASQPQALCADGVPPGYGPWDPPDPRHDVHTFEAVYEGPGERIVRFTTEEAGRCDDGSHDCNLRAAEEIVLTIDP